MPFPKLEMQGTVGTKIVPGKEFGEVEWVCTLVNLLDALLPDECFDPAKQPVVAVG